MKYTLKAQSVIMLRQLLSLPGWAKTIDQIYRGGKMISSLPEVKEGIPADSPVTIEMSGPERDLCKVAFDYALSKEAVPAGPFIVDILETLELVTK